MIELHPGDGGAGSKVIPAADTLAAPFPDEFIKTLADLAGKHFSADLQSKVVAATLKALRPTHAFDQVATIEAKNRAHDAVPASAGEVKYPSNMVLVSKDTGMIGEHEWALLKAEHDSFIKHLAGSNWSSRLGVVGSVLILTIILCGYCARYQPKLLRNHARAVALAALLLGMMLITQLAGLGTSTLYFFGTAPTVLAAIILTIAYDQRFAIGVGTILGILVTLALGQGISFFLILWAGVVTGCYLLNDIRSRSKLIEIGGLTGLAMVGATCVTGLLGFDPLALIARDCLYSAAAGLGVGFVILGILPFIEKAFRITTSMTLLELGDLHQPLLRRLATEAPGTYNHSLQVANLAEEAAEAIGANSLLCRVAAYYHDIGKIKKADYFVENQIDGNNRHLSLSPSVSILIIISHVKDGVELARQYKLPTNLIPLIQQHHGTTLVEFFYHRACCNQQGEVSETEYRYPGPKPRSREAAVLMLADAAESACRAMQGATATRIEHLVHDLVMKRFLDGQFDECDLTMRDLSRIEQSLVRGLLGIYHGRIAYPSPEESRAVLGPALSRTGL
jgi:putative nucleotidyltransferase with HDIG domain